MNDLTQEEKNHVYERARKAAAIQRFIGVTVLSGVIASYVNKWHDKLENGLLVLGMFSFVAFAGIVMSFITPKIIERSIKK